MSGISYALSVAIPPAIAGIAYGVIKCVQNSRSKDAGDNKGPIQIETPRPAQPDNVSVSINVNNNSNITINNPKPIVQAYGATQNPAVFA